MDLDACNGFTILILLFYNKRLIGIHLHLFKCTQKHDFASQKLGQSLAESIELEEHIVLFVFYITEDEFAARIVPGHLSEDPSLVLNSHVFVLCNNIHTQFGLSKLLNTTKLHAIRIDIPNAES